MFIKPFYLVAFSVVVIALTVLVFPSRNELSSIYFSSFDYRSAKVFIDSVLAEKANDIPAIEKLAAFYIIKGDTAKALLAYKRINQLRPKNIQYIKKIMQLYDWVGDPYERLKISEKQIPLLKTDKAKSELIRSIADGYRYLKKYPDANRMFNHLHQLTSDLNTLVYLAKYYLGTDQKEKSINYLELLIQHPDHPPRYRKMLADIYLYHHKYERALFHYLTIYQAKDAALLYRSDYVGSDDHHIKKHLNILGQIIQIYVNLSMLDLAMGPPVGRSVGHPALPPF